MMPEIKAIVLVPEKGDPLGLLADGVCGARPPTTYIGGEPVLRCQKCRTEFAGVEGKSYPNGVLCPECRGSLRGVCHPTGERIGGKKALVLAWDGKLVPEGIDRLGRPPGRCGLGWVRHVVGVHLGTRLDDSDARIDPDLPGTIVLLDADGKEIESEIVS